MRCTLALFICIVLGLCSCGGSSKTGPKKVPLDIEGLATIEKDESQSGLKGITDKNVYTEYTVSGPAGEDIVIQNSFPKGGGNIDGERGYTDSKGRNHAYAVFWTRVVNKTSRSLKISIDFPVDSLAIFSSPESYMKLFLPSDKMSLEKLSLYNYGIVGLKHFLDNNFNSPATLQRMMPPNNEFVFYTVMLSYQARGTPRAEFVMKEDELFYKASIAPLGSTLIPCGQIVLEE